MGVTPELEELAGCLSSACINGTANTTTTTTTPSAPHPSPPSPAPAHAMSRDRLSVACPESVATCAHDTPCWIAWQCMALVSDCEGASACLRHEIVAGRPSPAIEEMFGCLGTLCDNVSMSESFSV